MASPIRDHVIFHHTPQRGSAGIADHLRAPDVELAPVEQRAPSNGRLLRAFYDEETDRTFTLAVTRGASKRYLALPESAWRAMLPDLRIMHPEECSKSIIDLSTRWIVAFDDEDNSSLNTHQIDRDEAPERFTALTCIRDYLVQNNYAKTPSEAIDDGYDLRTGGRTTFAARTARAIDDEELHRRIDRITTRKSEFSNWTAGAQGDNPSDRMAALPEALKAERTRLEEQKIASERQLKGAARGNLRQIEALNRDLATLAEKRSALEHTTEISWACALLNHSYDHEDQADWIAPLRMAFDAKMILLEHFTQNARQPISEKDIQVFERRSTDIAALLIPPTLGQGDHVQSGEAILRLFYAGGDTLSNLVRQAPPTEEEDGETPMGIDIPTFTPVAPPQAAGHRYLREMLAQFHASRAQPQPLPEAQDIFNELDE